MKRLERLQKLQNAFDFLIHYTDEEVIEVKIDEKEGSIERIDFLNALNLITNINDVKIKVDLHIKDEYIETKEFFIIDLDIISDTSIWK